MFYVHLKVVVQKGFLFQNFTNFLLWAMLRAFFLSCIPRKEKTVGSVNRVTQRLCPNNHTKYYKTITTYWLFSAASHSHLQSQYSLQTFNYLIKKLRNRTNGYTLAMKLLFDLKF